MSQSLSKLFVHIVFYVGKESCEIRKEDSAKLFAYIGSVIKDNESIPILINGVEDHVHVFLVMSKNIALAKLVEEMKRHSSRWIKKQDSCYSKFKWQGGYAGFSVSPSLCDKTKKYISIQEEHHRKMRFKEEYLMF